ncbi:MAG TPA: PadR family transcriptional regulator [bacterium]|nr:PadR family transcriptional regulator [bacterium]
MGVKHAILGLLHFGDMHGYRIKELLQRDFGHMWTVNFGQIYPALRDMREEGLVTMSRVEGENAPDRKLYSITEEGRAEFRRWLESEPERGLTIRDPFLLRFAFFGFSDASMALERIDEQIKSYEEQLEQRRGKAPRRTLGNIQARLLSELGLRLNEAMLEWLGRAKKEIEAEAAAETSPRRVAGV